MIFPDFSYLVPFPWLTTGWTIDEEHFILSSLNISVLKGHLRLD